MTHTIYLEQKLTQHMNQYYILIFVPKEWPFLFQAAGNLVQGCVQKYGWLLVLLDETSLV